MVRVKRHSGGMLLLVQIGRSHAKPLDVRRGQVDGVVRHVLTPLHVDREDLETWLGLGLGFRLGLG